MLDGVSSHVQDRALREFDTFIALLRSKAIDVVIEDTIELSTPDSIFQIIGFFIRMVELVCIQCVQRTAV